MLKLYLLFILCVFLFLTEFFPIPTTYPSSNNVLEKVESLAIKVKEVYKSDVNKIILVLIDALRLDFITPENMPFTSSITHKHGCFINITVQTPTVTMPRIKALTTGNVPQYLDIVKNLATSEILIDSWLHSAKEENKKMVFYGDDTWLKLFPEFFIRSEGTSSFFVNDFKEVDDNVTRNVHLELQEKDFDIMILHYLGLDHIGHVLGPYSNLISVKLNEMDEVIKSIYENTVYKDNETVILVTGDHGMRDGGGHGGSTFSETNVPLLTIGLACENSTMQQTDIPVNLAVLLGIKIPSISIGQLNSKFLKKLSIEKYLYGLRYNTHMLLQKNGVCKKKFEEASNFHLEFLEKSNLTAAFFASTLYSDCSESITELLYERLVRRDIATPLSYIFIMISILGIIISKLLYSKSVIQHSEFLLFCLIISTKFFCMSGMISFIFLCMILKKVINFRKLSKLYLINTAVVIIIACLIHPFTLFSSSFIEEEHQFWYFLLNIFLIFCIFDVLKLHFQQKYLYITYLLVILCLFRFFIRHINSIGDKWGNYPDISDWLSKHDNIYSYHLYFALGLTVVWYILGFKGIWPNFLALIIFVCTFLLKAGNAQSVLLGKIIWFLILILKTVFKVSWTNCWILIITVLIKPYNIILIPYCVLSSAVFKKVLDNNNADSLTFVHLLLSSCLYFAQGHCNTLASVDVSSGYIGLAGYNPFLVLLQVAFHTFAFPVLCDFLVLSENVDKDRYFVLLFLHKSFVTTLTCIVTLINRDHLFIWSVFAPKLVIECVHFVSLFIKILVSFVVNFVDNYKNKK